MAFTSSGKPTSNLYAESTCEQPRDNDRLFLEDLTNPVCLG